MPQTDWPEPQAFRQNSLGCSPVPTVSRGDRTKAFWGAWEPVSLSAIRAKWRDYLDLLPLLLLQGRGELQSLLREALRRSVLGRAKLRQRYREERRAGPSGCGGRRVREDNTENETQRSYQRD